jgi:hypothetical protein
MATDTPSLDDVLKEVRSALTRLNREHEPSLPRYSSDDGLRIVEHKGDAPAQAPLRPSHSSQAA